MQLRCNGPKEAASSASFLILATAGAGTCKSLAAAELCAAAVHSRLRTGEGVLGAEGVHGQANLLQLQGHVGALQLQEQTGSGEVLKCRCGLARQAFSCKRAPAEAAHGRSPAASQCFSGTTRQLIVGRMCEPMARRWLMLHAGHRCSQLETSQRAGALGWTGALLRWKQLRQVRCSCRHCRRSC